GPYRFRPSFEFTLGSGLLRADASGGNVGFEVVFTVDGRARKAPEHGDLPDVIQRVGDGRLEQPFGGSVERLGRGEILIELFNRGKEALYFRVPGKRCRVVPGLIASRDRERPVKEIPHVREDLRGSARLVPDMEAGEMLGSAAQCFATAVRNGGKGVAQELTSRIGRHGHG